MAETRVEMLRRHVAEGRLRIQRQLKLIEDLERAGLPDVMARAREFLAQMRTFQREAQAHLAEEEEGRSRGNPSDNE